MSEEPHEAGGRLDLSWVPSPVAHKEWIQLFPTLLRRGSPFISFMASHLLTRCALRTSTGPFHPRMCSPCFVVIAVSQGICPPKPFVKIPFFFFWSEESFHISDSLAFTCQNQAHKEMGSRASNA